MSAGDVGESTPALSQDAADPGRPGDATAPSTPPRLARRAVPGGKRPAPVLLPTDAVTALLVDLPRAPARQRAALLTFAVEDRIGSPIDSVVVAQGPLSGAPDTALALVLSRDRLAKAAAAAPEGAALLPDFLLLRRPEPTDTGPSWAVWREGDRAVVRVSDGTGLAVAAAALPALWRRAGRPELLRLAEALPGDLPVTDLSDAPPPPDPADLAFSFRRDPSAETTARLRRPLIAAGVALLAGLALHLALAAADAVALDRVATRERALAQARVDAVMPGLPVAADPAPVLARLAPTAARAPRSDFLPLLAEVSAAAQALDTPVGFRRLSWGAQDGTLLVQVEAPGLDDLQGVQRHLQGEGFDVASGTANAGDGMAEVEMRISRGAGG